jgi:hypothetical protein
MKYANEQETFVAYYKYLSAAWNWEETTSQSQSYFTTDRQSASLSWCQDTIRARDQFIFLLDIFLRQLWVCYVIVSSLTRGWI